MWSYYALQNKDLLTPSDRSIATIKLLHKEWPQKSYKSYAQLIHGKLEKIHLAQNIEGARRVWAQLDQQQGKLLLCWCCIFVVGLLTLSALYCHHWFVTASIHVSCVSHCVALLSCCFCWGWFSYMVAVLLRQCSLVSDVWTFQCWDHLYLCSSIGG